MKLMLVLMSLMALNSRPVFAQNKETEMQIDNRILEAGAVDCERCYKNSLRKSRTEPNASQVAAQILDQKKSPVFDSPESRQ